jgi:FkbM family methyltransferase
MKFKELFYMLGIRPKIKSFGYDLINVEYENGKRCEWALWKNPRDRVLPRIQDYDFLKLFLNPGDLAIDLGAHVGDTTLSMALCTGKQGCTIALEPNPTTYKILAANANLNEGITNIVSINAAAMQHEGDYIFQYNDPSLTNGGYQKGVSIFKHASFFKVDVKGINLSELLEKEFKDHLSNLKFIKTDLEGGDYVAFLTIKHIIQKYMPVIQSEVNGVMSKDVRISYISDLKRMDYQVFSLGSLNLDSIQNLNDEMVDSSETFDIVAIPPNLQKYFSEFDITFT